MADSKMAVASSASASDLTSVIIDMNSITGHELDALTEGATVYCVLCRNRAQKAVSVCVVKAKKDTHHDVWNCKGCKRLKERINEFQRTNEYFKMFHQMSKEKKAEFFPKITLAYGARSICIIDRHDCTNANRVIRTCLHWFGGLA